MARSWARGAAALLTLVVVWVATAGTAGAHTSLVGSQPPDGAALEDSPREVVLEFARAVDPRLVSAVLLSADGGTRTEPDRVTPDRPDSTLIAFRLPELVPATYGLQWQTVGLDGHRVQGEVVFVVAVAGSGTELGAGGENERAPVSAPVGAGPAASAGGKGRAHLSTGPGGGERLVEALRTGARVLWYVGIVLLVGALFVTRWLRRHPAPSADDDQRLGATASWAGRAGSRLAVFGAIGAWATTVIVMVNAQSGGPSLSALRLALGARVALGELAMVAVLLVLVGSGLPAGAADRRALARPVVGVVVAVMLHSAGGHATDAAGIVPWVGQATLSAVHGLAAALWLGPLAVMAPWLVRVGRDVQDRQAAGDLARRFLAGYARLAQVAFVALSVTGFVQLWARTGFRLHVDAYWSVLAFKGLLVGAVAVPVGWYHHRRFARSRASSITQRGTVGRTVRVEVIAGLTIASLGAVLAGMAPSAPPTGAISQPIPTVLAAAERNDDCVERVVGKASCYRQYFAGVLAEVGAAEALGAIDQARTEDPFVEEQCHQLTHDLGNDATSTIGLAEALSVDASLCASGYYHGAVEVSLDDVDDAELAELVPQLCDPVAVPRYSSRHFGCVHGVGHALMLRGGLDLNAALRSCDFYEDTWEMQSCLGGTFMENVVAAQEGHGGGSFRADEPLYPCSEARADQKAPCYSIHTGYLLWRTNFDLAAVFELCDRAEVGYVDDCYQSMGRDISGAALLDPHSVVDGCQLGGPQWRGSCYVGAALNAVYTEGATESADALCDIVAPEHQVVCRRAVASLAGQLS